MLSLLEMFPDVTRDVIRRLVVDEGHAAEEAVEILLNRKVRPQRGSEHRGWKTVMSN